MANQLQATVYQIGAVQQTDSLTMTFPTTKIVISEAVLPTISAVNARIDLYSNPNSKPLYVSYYVAETVADLLTAANTGGTSMFGATVASINLSPFRTTVDYAFPVNGVSLWPYVSGTVNSFVNFMGVKYYALETVATLEAAANTGVAPAPTEWIYVSGPVNKVYQLSGTNEGKSKYVDPSDTTNYVQYEVSELSGNSWNIYVDDVKTYDTPNAEGDTPESGGWLYYANDYPADIYITRYSGTQQEVLEAISQNLGVMQNPTEFLYVSSPVNKVFRLDGTENGKNKYTDPDDATNRIEWGLGNSWVIYLNDSIIYYNDTGIGDYPVSQNWLLDSNDDPAPISITRYHGTLQEVLEQISKPKEWPKVYRALLTQSGTDAPVATVLENTLGGEVVWSYVNVGAYRATLASAFPQDKTIFFIGTREGNAANSTQGNNYAYRVTDNEIEVTTAKADDTYENGNLVYTSFEILVYP